MIRAKNTKNKWLLGLIFIFFLHLFTNIWVLHKDNIYPLYLGLGSIEEAHKLIHSVSEGRIQELFNNPSVENPPFMNYFLMFTMFCFGKNPDMIMHTNMFFLIILIYALYNFGKKIGDESTGFISVIICLSFPSVFGMSRIMWNEYPLMCVSVLSCYLLFNTDYFRNKKYSFLWSFSLACGLLIRFVLPIYIIAPVSFYIIKAFMVRSDYRQLIKRLIFCFFVIFLFSGWWYIFNGKNTIASRLLLFEGVNLDLLANIARMLYFLCHNNIYLPLLTLFIISLPLLLVKCTVEKFIIMLGVVAPLALFIIAPGGSGFASNRYFIPILPFIALSISSAIFLINKKFLKIFVNIILAIFCLTQFILVNIGLGDILRFSSDLTTETDEFIICEQGKIKSYSSAINPDDVLNAINREKKEELSSLLFLGDFPNIESFFRFQYIKGNKDIDVISYLWQIKAHPSLQNTLDNSLIVDKAEFVLALTGKQSKLEDARHIYSTRYIPKMISFFESKKSEYKKLISFKDKFGIEAALFHKVDKF